MEQIKFKSKRVHLLFVAIIAISMLSCGGETSKASANAEGFHVIENEIENKFGENAFFTDLTITYDASIGNAVIITVTKDPESLKMGQWNLVQDSWKQNSEVTLEVPEGMKASDFMFQLNGKISLSKLGELVEKSIEKLKSEKDIDNPTLSIANVKFPKNGDVSKTEYTIHLKPENGGTTYSFSYNLSGDLINMDY